MSSLLNNASLLLNPAGSIISYQEDKIYSVLPRNGTGDFTFSGGDGGTRVNQQGYVEVTPANTNTYSENFGPGYWNNFGGTITDNSVVAPNGTVTGTTFNGNPAGTYKQFPGIVPGQVYTVSMYVKLGTATNCVIIINNTQAWNTVGGKSFTSADGLNTTDWTRISFTFTGPAFGAINWHIGVHSETAVTQQTNGTYFVWGAMLNIGSTAKPYQPTTDRLNYPRITYQNGRGALLSEPQRTNLNTYSQFISSSTYSYTGLTIVYGSTTSPDGTQNASKLVEDTSTNQRYINKTSPFGSYGTYVCSFYAKPSGREWIYFEVGAVYAYANIANGTLGSAGSFNAGWAFNNYGIEPWKDGWYRVWITGTWSSGGAYFAPKIHPATSNGNFIYTGDGVSGIYVYGIQVEPGSYPTSYIPTTSATVTRPADSTSNATSFQTTGVASNGAWSLILEGSEVTLTTQGFQYYSGGTYLGGHYGTTFIVINSSGGETYPFSLTQPRFRIGLSWNGTTLNAYENGISVLSTTNVLSAYNTFSTLLLNNGGGSTLSYPKAAVYNTALSTAQLQELTTYRSGSGGNISYYGPYTIHTFTGSATFTPSFTGPVEVLVVAGGGGGGNNHAGGGGAGGLLYVSSYGVSSGTGITVTVGAGGTSPVSNPDPVTNGSNSVFGGLTAIGGGGGGNRNDFNNNSPGGNGGSGGGGGGSQAVYPGNWVPGNGVPGQGNNGGYGVDIYGGGGGGAGAVGTVGAASSAGGNGGNGLPYSISGFSTYYAGGGGGGYCPSAGGGNGGLGGGGKGGILVTDKGTPGVPYTGAGGGGGGAGGTQGSIGGAGIVIVRYLT
jgi:hypothetical protein